MPTLTLSLHTVNPGEINNWLMDYDFKIRVGAGVLPGSSSRGQGQARRGSRQQGGGKEGQQAAGWLGGGAAAAANYGDLQGLDSGSSS